MCLTVCLDGVHLTGDKPFDFIKDGNKDAMNLRSTTVSFQNCKVQYLVTFIYPASKPASGISGGLPERRISYASSQSGSYGLKFRFSAFSKFVIGSSSDSAVKMRFACLPNFFRKRFSNPSFSRIDPQTPPVPRLHSWIWKGSTESILYEIKSYKFF